LEIQRRENDLVAATFGRGFYVLDDYSVLRQVDASELQEHEATLFPVKTAELYIPEDKLGGRVGSQGSSCYSADNPPFGAVFTLYLRDSFQTKKQQRREKEREIQKEGGDNPRPEWDEIKAEDREVDPVVIFEIRDGAEQVVDRVVGPTSAGLHRVAWALRYAPFVVRTDSESTSGRRRRRASGPLVAPGTYSVQAFARSGDETKPLGEAQQFEVKNISSPTLDPQDREKVLAFQMQLGKLQQGVTGARSLIADAITQLGQVRSVIVDGRQSDLRWLDELRSLETEFMDARESLSGDPTRSSRYAVGAPSVSSRLQTALSGSLTNLYGITTTQREQYEIAKEEYDAAIGKVQELLNDKLPAYFKKLDEAGVPWTPGRGIPRVR
jgi:hypothetical protein